MQRNRELISRLGNEIPHLKRYAYSLTRQADQADDLVQDCLERAVAKSNQFQTGTDSRRWLFAIMRNAFIDKQRKRARRGAHVPIEEWYRETHMPAAQIKHMEMHDVWRAIGGLRRCDQEIVRRVVFEGQKYKDVADDLGVAVGTVKSRLSRARRTLAA